MTADEARAMNATMTARLLDGPAQPLVEGGIALRVVVTAGRRSGVERSIPLGVLTTGGQPYLVSPVAARDWVRNLRAGAACSVLPGPGSMTAVEVNGEDAVAVVGAYLAAATVPWAIAAFPVGAQADAAEIREHLGEMAVFRLDHVPTG